MEDDRRARELKERSRAAFDAQAATYDDGMEGDHARGLYPLVAEEVASAVAGKEGPRLLDLGVLAMVGKGTHSPEVREAIVRNGACYLAAVGGAAALIARCVRSAEVVAYEDLRSEAVRRLEVVDMPLTVVIDPAGTDLYEEGPAAWRASRGGGDA